MGLSVCARFCRSPFSLLFVTSRRLGRKRDPLTLNPNLSCARAAPAASFLSTHATPLRRGYSDGAELRRRRGFDAGSRREGARAVGDGEAGRPLRGKERYVRYRHVSVEALRLFRVVLLLFAL